jgi:hypothetical protein
VSRAELPPPNPQAGYQGSCVVCGLGSDVRVAFDGSPEYLVAMLQTLGVPVQESPGIYQLHQRDNGWPGVEVGGLRVCDDCTDRGATNPPFGGPES